jgi:DNA-binding transcriptional ArsR family regulator
MVDNEIIGSFVKSYDRELTINQIAKEIKKSYGSINQHVNLLIKKGLIIKREVGSAILCKLNYNSKKVMAYLVFNSMLDTSLTKENIPDEIDCMFKLGKDNYYFINGSWSKKPTVKG